MEIKTASFVFNLKALEPIILPSYKGSTLRGGFGAAFKRVVCMIKDKECLNCLLKEKCIYSYIFETPPPKDTKIMRKYTSAPHPFVIEPPEEKRMGYKPGDSINFSLILIGKAIDYLPYFVYTFQELGRIGIGKGRGKFELQEVSCNGETIYDSLNKTLKSITPSTLSVGFDDTYDPFTIETLTLNFLTPTRILYDNHLTIEFDFEILIRQLLRRISLLYYFHCNGDPSEWDFRRIINKSKQIETIKRMLDWYDWERYSARQDTRMKLGGFVGEITFKGNIEPFIPLIKAGEVLHIGKGTSFGLGKYEIEGVEHGVRKKV